MVAIIYLDIDDEITSAAARLRTVEASRIALVLPIGSRLATSRINFRLLAREAAGRKKALEIVSGDASARALAASAGLPTHVSVAAFEGGAATAPGSSTSLANAGGDGRGGGLRGSTFPRVVGDDSPTVALPTVSAPRTAEPTPKVGRRPASRTAGRRLAFALGLVVIVAGAGAVGFQLLPSAAIVLTPTVSALGPLALNVTAQPGITQPDPVGLFVPATTFTFEVEVSSTFLATGVMVVDTAATGEVTFSSLNTGAPNTIPSGSIVRTESGIEFRTTGAVTLPAAQIGIVNAAFVVIPSTRNIGIEAVVSGESGNVPAGSIVGVPQGENPQRTIVKNNAPTAGGSHTESPQIQQADVDAALRALDDALATRFAEQVASPVGVPAGTTLFPETRMLGPAIQRVDPTTLPGLEVAQFELGLAAQGSVLGVDPGPVSTLADAHIRSAVHRGFRLNEDSVSIDIGTPIVAGTTITFPVTVRAIETRELDGAALLAQVRGLGLPQARTILNQYGAVTISVWPDWVTTIPTITGRASLTIEPATDETGPAGTPGPAESG